MADLTTAARVKLKLFPDGYTPDTDADTVLAQLIADVSDWVQLFTGRLLTPLAAQTYYLDTGPGSTIAVPFGVRVVSSLSVATGDQPDDGSGTYTAVAATDVLLRPSSALRRPGWPATSILIRGSAPRLRQALNGAKLVADVGFASTPDSLRGVVDDAVVTAYRSRTGASGTASGEGSAPAFPWTSFFAKGSPAYATLMRYKVPGIA